ncbi:hypothetical protein B1987_10205 [Mycobacterium kansasii]|uniref:Uncharacterized protein n=1 Tax=Mycobacterium attenuatum TaxID=2341086 RepID=A0A498QDV6_9MYCO|nr:hypothetical protein [Mycobacterium attenuatum]ORB84106.1 hypothetical protein B1987_10205 [Mycobacterium kansasii]VBA42665.1 hypothetical protein LAUMK136_04693 [Mycobacterium attenuatum]VBA58777.1 hypothetical protein LAUMK191_04684 [Mycobacterium attenuatum]VBA61441.1 hypothetical protein LAUMK41_04817 [Mycobacterium attenuatum]
MVNKILLSAAIVLGAAAGVAAPAAADPSTSPTGPADGIGPLALTCPDNTECPPVGSGNAPTINPQQLTQAIKNGFAAPSDFSDTQGQR